MVAGTPALYAPPIMGRRPRDTYNEEPPPEGTFGWYIWHRRWIELGLTQQELAARLVDLGAKMEQGDISDLERGVVKLPRQKRMGLIARALNVSLARLYTWAGEEEHGALAEEPPVYDATFEELSPFTEEELRQIRALKARLQAAREEATRRHQPPRRLSGQRSTDRDEQEAVG